jgi:hypothetical protein
MCSTSDYTNKPPLLQQRNLYKWTFNLVHVVLWAVIARAIFEQLRQAKDRVPVEKELSNDTSLH